MAMLVMLDPTQRQALLTPQDIEKTNKMIQEVLKGIEQTGIIIGAHDGIPQFTHRIFAEYFVACWMNDNKHRMRDESFFRS